VFRPGELDEKIDFKREVKVSDGMGGYEITLADISTNVWCKVRPLSGGESERFDKLNAEELTLFVTRYRTDIEEDDRISWNGEQYNIRHIPRTSRRHLYTQFYAERGVAQ
jgi:SPP1 family predicted phage head-tail adaptor